MNVLIVSNMGPKKSAPNQGGFVLNQVKRFEQSNSFSKVSYFWMKWNGDSLFHKLLKYPLFFVKFLFCYVVSKNKYDIIHIHYYFPTIFCALIYKYLRNRSCKIVVTCHGSDIYNYDNPSWLYRKLAEYVDHWVFTSKQLKGKFFRDVSNYSILCAGYDEQVFYKRENTKKKYDFILVGSLDVNKGIDRLLTLAASFKEVSFALVGTGNISNSFAEKFNSLPNLHLIGSLSQNQVVNVMSESRFLISLSRNESFGLVIAEANAVGTPCIATVTDGSMEQLEGWPMKVFQEGKKESVIIDELTSIITEMLALSQKGYSDLSNNAVELVEKYRLSKVTSELITIYEQQLGRF